MASRSIIICRSRRLRQIIYLRDADKSRYFAITEFDNCFIIRSPAFAHLRTHSLNFAMFFFKYFCFFAFSKQRKSKVFTYISKRFGTLFRLWWGQCYPTRTQVRALLSRSSREMKFDSSSWYVKAGLLRFWDNVRVFLQTTHFVKSRAHSPIPTSKIIAMIALRRAILMKGDPVVSLPAHRLLIKIIIIIFNTYIALFL